MIRALMPRRRSCRPMGELTNRSASRPNRCENFTQPRCGLAVTVMIAVGAQCKLCACGKVVAAEVEVDVELVGPDLHSEHPGGGRRRRAGRRVRPHAWRLRPARCHHIFSLDGIDIRFRGAANGVAALGPWALAPADGSGRRAMAGDAGSVQLAGQHDPQRARSVAHLAQRPEGDVEDTRWRYSLMNWGHDPLK
jgi:hypothetical protein